MLGMKAYGKEYIDDVRARVASDIAAFKSVADFASTGATDLEHAFFNNLLLALDYSFVHRLRTVEGKDGNAMNEVRVLCDSILLHKGRMTLDKAIKLSPANSILKLNEGDPIQLTEADFHRIYEPFMAAIAEKFA